MNFFFTRTTLALSSIDSAVSDALSAIAILLLIFLLCQREFMRVIDERRSHCWTAALDTAIVPLLVTFGLIVIARLLTLLGVL
jgi:hypothetical protein